MRGASRLPLCIGLLSLAFVAGGCGLGAPGMVGLPGQLVPGSTAAPNGLVRVSSSTAVPAAGDLVDVDVILLPGTVPAIYGAGFDLRYDPAILEYAGVDGGASYLAGATAAGALRGGKAGRAVVAIAKEGPVPGDPAAGVLVRVQFRVLAGGTSPLVFEETVCADGGGTPISLRLPASTVTIP